MQRSQLTGVAPGIALLPLRLFLGGTFVYAGIQKLSDPGFLHAGAPTYIGTQLHAFANGTPGGFILRAFAIPHAELAGIGVAIVEIAIGLCAFFVVLATFQLGWGALVYARPSTRALRLGAAVNLLVIGV